MFGILNCNKPVGMTSRDLVNIIQRRLRPLKVGHAGTLDPLASGVLLVAVGPAVRLVPYLQQQSKQYAACFRLGQSSATGDLEGPLVDHPELPQPTAAQLQAAIEAQTGAIQQVPPDFSAVKIQGRRACDLVRAGQAVQLQPRTVQIHRIDQEHYAYPDLALRITCGSGTYIRSLGVDIAAGCGTTAVMTSLVRTAIGAFRLEQAIALDQLREGPLAPHLAPPATAVAQLAQVQLDDAEAEAIGHGKTIPLTIDSDQPEVAALDRQGQLRAILVRRDDRWRPRRVFPLR